MRKVNDFFLKMNQHLANLEALSSDCQDCQKIGLDYRVHLVHHTKHGLIATSDATSAKNCSRTEQIHQVESAATAHSGNFISRLVLVKKF